MGVTFKYVQLGVNIKLSTFVINHHHSHTQNKQVPIFGYFNRVFKEYLQKSQIWQSDTSPNQETWLEIPRLGLVSLCQIILGSLWVFHKFISNLFIYLKNPKMGNLVFFPVIYIVPKLAMNVMDRVDLNES